MRATRRAPESSAAAVAVISGKGSSKNLPPGLGLCTAGFPNSGFAKFGDWTGGGAQQLGMALFTEYLLPFEVTSVLILIAIVGAIVLARKELD